MPAQHAMLPAEVESAEHIPEPHDAQQDETPWSVRCESPGCANAAGPRTSAATRIGTRMTELDGGNPILPPVSTARYSPVGGSTGSPAERSASANVTSDIRNERIYLSTLSRVTPPPRSMSLCNATPSGVT